MIGQEKRFLNSEIEIRKNDDGTQSRTIEGYAIVFNQWSKRLGWFVEQIDSRALDGVDMSDVVATFNHDFDKPMARSKKGTLKLEVDKRGLKFSFDAPNTTSGNDLLENIRNGNVDGCSFMFTVDGEEWEWSKDNNEPDKRTVTKIGSLFELGPVTMPAYDQTTVAARSRDEVFKEFNKEDVKPNFDTKFLDLDMRMAKVRN